MATDFSGKSFAEIREITARTRPRETASKRRLRSSPRFRGTVDPETGIRTKVAEQERERARIKAEREARDAENRARLAAEAAAREQESQQSPTITQTTSQQLAMQTRSGDLGFGKDEEFARRIAESKEREKRFFQSEGFLRIQKVSGILTGGGPVTISERKTRAGRVAQTVVTGFVGLPFNIAGAGISTGEKVGATIEGLSRKESRSRTIKEFKRAAKDPEFKKTFDIKTEKGQSTLISAALIAGLGAGTKTAIKARAVSGQTGNIRPTVKIKSISKQTIPKQFKTPTGKTVSGVKQQTVIKGQIQRTGKILGKDVRLPGTQKFTFKGESRAITPEASKGIYETKGAVFTRFKPGKVSAAEFREAGTFKVGKVGTQKAIRSKSLVRVGAETTGKATAISIEKTIITTKLGKIGVQRSIGAFKPIKGATTIVSSKGLTLKPTAKGLDIGKAGTFPRTIQTPKISTKPSTTFSLSKTTATTLKAALPSALGAPSGIGVQPLFINGTLAKPTTKVSFKEILKQEPVIDKDIDKPQIPDTQFTFVSGQTTTQQTTQLQIPAQTVIQQPIIEQPSQIIAPSISAPFISRGFGGFGFFEFPKLGGIEKETKGKRGRQPKKTTPTFFANVFNITGKTTRFGVVSGLGIRPLKRKKPKSNITVLTRKKKKGRKK